MSNADDPNQPKEGLSTGAKWWIGGCGGCLVVAVIIAVIAVALGMKGMDSLKQMSNQSVQGIFGPAFKAEPYTAIGMPLGSKEFKSMVMMINPTQGSLVFAVDSALPEEYAAVLKSGDPQQVGLLMKTFSSRATSQSAPSASSSKVKDIAFTQVKSVILPNGKHVSVGYATMASEKRGVTNYSPAVIALIPEAGQRLIGLVAMNPQNTSTEAGTDFSPAQNTLETEVVRLIKESDLDDRLQ